MNIELTEKQLVKLARILFDYCDRGSSDPFDGEGWKSQELKDIEQVIETRLRDLNINWL